jgi:hypothetical protein
MLSTLPADCIALIGSLVYAGPGNSRTVLTILTCAKGFLVTELLRGVAGLDLSAQPITDRALRSACQRLPSLSTLNMSRCR